MLTAKVEGMMAVYYVKRACPVNVGRPSGESEDRVVSAPADTYFVTSKMNASVQRLLRTGSLCEVPRVRPGGRVIWSDPTI